MPSHKKYITVSAAVQMAKHLGVQLSRVTIIKHAANNYGHQIGDKGGKWYIDREKFRSFINGKNKSASSNNSPADETA